MNQRIAAVTRFVTLLVAQSPGILWAGADDSIDLRAYFWQEVIGDRGKEYQRPAVVVVDQARTGCLGMVQLEPSRFAVLYCRAEATIYLDLAWLTAEARVFGRPAVAVILSHEWAHHVQNLLGVDFWRSNLNGNLSARFEQQADCMAGAWVGDAAGRELVRADDVNRVVAVMRQLGGQHGDERFVPDAFEDRHGTGEPRSRAFRRGYTVGLVACPT